MSTQKSTTSDIQKFIDKFEPNKFKVMPAGIEIRGMSNIHHGMEMAKQIIERLKLNLKVSHSADMVGYGAFEVIQNSPS